MDEPLPNPPPAVPPAPVTPALDPVQLFSAFGDEVRWGIVRELADGSALTVLELAARLRRNANLVSKHLRVLREAQAVTVREVPGEDRRKSHYEVPAWTRSGAAPGSRVVDYGCCVLRF